MKTEKAMFGAGCFWGVESSFRHLLEVFWEIHDPTTPNRQRPDRGDRYRHPIVTEINPAGEFYRAAGEFYRAAGEFYRAEEYHQRYNEKHGRLSCGF